MKNRSRYRRRHTLPLKLAGPAVMIAAMVGIGFAEGDLHLPGSGLFDSNCRIKGNIAASGERIYHVPGQEYYPQTRIDLVSGERWFCSETDARTAGWRRSKV